MPGILQQGIEGQHVTLLHLTIQLETYLQQDKLHIHTVLNLQVQTSKYPNAQFGKRWCAQWDALNNHMLLLLKERG